MLKISAAQFEALKAVPRQAFIKRTIARLEERIPAFLNGLSPAQANHRVDTCIARAESYGLTTEHQIWSFIAIQATLGLAFDKDPKFADVVEELQDDDLMPDQRIDRATVIVDEMLAEDTLR
ncbi:hypothetical protein [Candidatus Thiosymbion oneisti]|uniref:hypothetical protein n=1 Tax=Candidatus Thiosymbion oneisti TaxID=589554 RepID=UPI000B7FB17B|nr:hypothetical protein [Candidatus Thiosymbion oneisti]